MSLKLELGREGEGPTATQGLPQGDKADFPAHLGLLSSYSLPPQPPEQGRDCGRQDNVPQNVHGLHPGTCGYVRIHDKGE